MDLLTPHPLEKGQTIGVFTPSTPAYAFNEEMFSCGIKNIEALGFCVKLGGLTQRRSVQGYRSGTPEQRAHEFMELVEDPNVHGLISTIGGNNSSSMIPHLDFAKIRKSQKAICGYSDVTSLHLSILHYSRLKTFYGPALMTWFGEYPNGIVETTESFMQALTQRRNTPRRLTPFERWSNHLRRWENGDWKKLPRQWNANDGWRILSPGRVNGEVVVANLNTLLTAAGTPYFPDLREKILLIEDMDAPHAEQERSLMQLRLMGVFEQISALVYSKPEFPNAQGADFSLDELLQEVVGNRSYPVITQFDCGHTVPMHTIMQASRVRIEASGGEVVFEVEAV